MHTYRCYFLDDHERINADESIEADAPIDALDRALAMLYARPHHRAVEVWQGVRRLYLSTIEHDPSTIKHASDSLARSAGQERAN